MSTGLIRVTFGAMPGVDVADAVDQMIHSARLQP